MRERGDEVEFLAAFFAERHAVKRARPELELSTSVLELLRRYPFPGNVRELENAVERAVAFTTDGTIEVQHLPTRLRETAPSVRSSAAPSWMPETDGLPPLAEVECRYVRHVLDAADGNKRQAARLLGIARRTLYRKLEEMEEADA